MVKHHRSKHTKKRSRSVKRSFKCGKKVKKQTRKTKPKIKTKNIVTYKKCGGGETPNVKHIPMAFSSNGDKVVYGETVEKRMTGDERFGSRQSAHCRLVHYAYLRCALESSNPLVKHYRPCVSKSKKETGLNMWHKGTVRYVALSPDGETVATCSDGEGVLIWTPMSSAGSGELYISGYNKGLIKVSSVAFSPDGTKVVAGSNDGRVRIWTEHESGERWGSKMDIYPGSKELHSETAIMWVKKGKVTSVAFNNNGTKVVAGYDDGTARIWEVKDRITTEPMMIMMHNSSSNSVAFSPDGEKVVAGYHDGTVIIWDVKPVEEPAIANEENKKSADLGVITVEEESAGKVDNTSADPDKNEISGGLGMSWFSRKKEELPQSPQPPSYPLAKCLAKMKEHGDIVNSVAFSPDGTKVVSGSDDKTVIIWDVKTVEQPKKMTVDNSNVKLVAFNDDGNKVVAGYDNGTVRIWDVTTGNITMIIRRGNFEDYAIKSKTGDFSVSPYIY